MKSLYNYTIISFSGILAVSAYPLEKLLSMTYEDVKYFEAMQKIVEKK